MLKTKENSLIFVLSATVIFLLASIITMLYRPSTPQEVVTREESVEPVYLHTEEAVIITGTSSDAVLEVLPIEPVLFEYIEVVDGCGPHYEGDCLNVRSGPGTEFPVVRQLRNDIVLKVGGSVEREDGVWYHIVFDEWLRYPDRVGGEWYVHADFVEVLYDEGDKTLEEHGAASTSEKVIRVSRSEQMLSAYENDVLTLRSPISTGLEMTPTPRGTFTIYKKTPSRYMQGPLPNLADRSVYDLPGVPWNLYFTEGGAVIHGAYWHESFGSRYSHGCVNLPSDVARKLYNWADLGTQVIVSD